MLTWGMGAATRVTGVGDAMEVRAATGVGDAMGVGDGITVGKETGEQKMVTMKGAEDTLCFSHSMYQVVSFLQNSSSSSTVLCDCGVASSAPSTADFTIA